MEFGRKCMYVKVIFLVSAMSMVSIFSKVAIIDANKTVCKSLSNE